MTTHTLTKKTSAFMVSAAVLAAALATPGSVAFAEDTPLAATTNTPSEKPAAPTNNDIGIVVGVDSFGLYNIPGHSDRGFGTQWDKRFPEEKEKSVYKSAADFTLTGDKDSKKAVVLALAVAKQAKARALTKHTIAFAEKAGYTGNKDTNDPQTVEDITAWASAVIYATLDKTWDVKTLKDAVPVAKDFQEKLKKTAASLNDDVLNGVNVQAFSPEDERYQVVIGIDSSKVPNALTLINNTTTKKPEPSSANKKPSGSSTTTTPSTEKTPQSETPKARPVAGNVPSLRTSAQLENVKENTTDKPQEGGSNGVALKDQIEKLRVDNNYKPSKKYDRKAFAHWSKVSEQLGWTKELSEKYKNCTSREAVLLMQGKDVSREGENDCKIKVSPGGGWKDVYGFVNGTTVQFDPMVTEAKKVDIDHIVPLKNAWISGADKFTNDQREKFANDVNNLVATTQKTNRAKGDKSAADYLPPSEFKCDYISRYVELKNTYKLSVTEKEKSRLAKESESCTDKQGENNQDENKKPQVEATVVDTVSYKGLTPGKQYTVKGELMDTEGRKPTGITAEQTFTPDAPQGEVKVTFNVEDAGKKFTVFETLYDSEGKQVAEHKDFADRAQTVNGAEKQQRQNHRRGVGVAIRIGGNGSRTGSGAHIDTEATSSTGPNLQTGTTVDDKVTYRGLKPGQKYRLEARLICKADGKDTKASQTHEFTAAHASGEEVVKGIAVTNPDCLEQVVFQKLYEVGEKGEGVLVATHEDLDAKSQTVGGKHVGKKKKKTGDTGSENEPVETKIEYAPYPDYGAPRQLIDAVPSGSSSMYGATIFTR